MPDANHAQQIASLMKHVFDQISVPANYVKLSAIFDEIRNLGAYQKVYGEIQSIVVGLLLTFFLFYLIKFFVYDLLKLGSWEDFFVFLVQKILPIIGVFFFIYKVPGLNQSFADYLFTAGAKASFSILDSNGGLFYPINAIRQEEIINKTYQDILQEWENIYNNFLLQHGYKMPEGWIDKIATFFSLIWHLLLHERDALIQYLILWTLYLIFVLVIPMPFFIWWASYAMWACGICAFFALLLPFFKLSSLFMIFSQTRGIFWSNLKYYLVALLLPFLWYVLVPTGFVLIKVGLMAGLVIFKAAFANDQVFNALSVGFLGLFTAIIVGFFIVKLVISFPKDVVERVSQVVDYGMRRFLGG